jgi:hypothetical protein
MIVGIILSLGTDLLLHNIQVFPPWGASMAGYEGALLFATIYRTIYGVSGSYIAARLAPDRPMLHAMVLGVLGFAVSIPQLNASCRRENIDAISPSHGA